METFNEDERRVRDCPSWCAGRRSRGGAEILWIGAYGTLTGSDIAEVARSISTVVKAALPVSALITVPVASGIAIHMLAAIALGIALAFTWRELSARKSVSGDEYAFMPAVLAIVWGFNFFVALPLISPYFVDLHRSFIEIVPYPVSLVSKLLFGLAAAAVLNREASCRPILIRV